MPIPYEKKGFQCKEAYEGQNEGKQNLKSCPQILKTASKGNLNRIKKWKD